MWRFTLVAAFGLGVAACAHHPPPAPSRAAGNSGDEHVSPDGQWAVVREGPGESGKGRAWAGVVERATGRRSLTVSEDDSGDSLYPIEAVAWAPQSDAVGLRLRIGHYNDQFALLVRTGRGWKEAVEEEPNLGPDAARQPEARGHTLDPHSGTWVEEMEWRDPHTLQVTYDAEFGFTDQPNSSAWRFAQEYQYSVDGGRVQTRKMELRTAGVGR